MKYLILSMYGLLLFIGERLNEPDVEKIYFWCRDYRNKSGDKLKNLPGWEKFEAVSDFSKVLLESSKEELIIVVDSTGLGATADYLRKEGWKVIGATQFTDKIEGDRTYASQLAKKIMRIPETYDFSSFIDILSFLKTQNKEERFVFKPNDNDAPKESTYVGKDIPDLIDAIKRFKQKWDCEESFQLQKFIKGIEVDFNGYFNGDKFIKDSHLLTFENKPLMNGDIGPATGGAVTVQFARPLEGKLFDILNKTAPYLKKAGYIGQISINSIVSEEDHEPYFLEFTPRFGYPSIELETTQFEEKGKSLHQFLKSLAMGEDKSFFQLDKIVVGLSIYKAPYPDQEDFPKINEGLPISWDKKYDRYFFPYSISYDKKNGMVLSGASGDVCVCTCIDSTLDGAVSMLYDTYMKTFRMQDAMYRTDLGKSAKERIKKLQEWKII